MTIAIKNKVVNLLKWSEKYTGTDMVYLAQGGLWLFLNQVVNFIFSLGLVWLFANLLSQETYGQYRFLITMMSLFTLASLPGMGTAIVRAVARGHSGVIPYATRTRVRWGLLGSLAAFLVASYYFLAGDVRLALLFLLVACFVPVYDSFTVAQNYYNGIHNYRKYTVVSIVRYGFITATTAATIVLGGNIFAIVGIYIASTALINFLIYLYLKSSEVLSEERDNETIQYGKKLTATALLGTVASHLDKVALWYLAGPVQVAMYTIAIALPKEIANALNHVGKLALPKMAKRDTHMLRQSLLRKLFIFFLATLPVASIYAVAAPTIFNRFLPQYADTAYFSQLAALLIVFAPLVLLIQYFNATMHIKALSWLGVSQPIIGISLYLILIPQFGVLGAVYALVGRQLTDLALLLFFFLRDRG